MPKRVDDGQAAIVAGLREAGCVVQDLHAVGHGVPDLLVCTPAGDLCLMEVKAAHGKLNSREALWHANWPGTVWIVRSVEDALAVVRGDADANDCGIDVSVAAGVGCNHSKR